MKCTKWFLTLFALLAANPAIGQAPSFADGQLDLLVSRIALYPDSLLAQVLAAATFPDQIPEAAQWADKHHDLDGQALAQAMRTQPLPWDPTIQALLPFPLVLKKVAQDRSWTVKLGNAVLAQQGGVLDAAQRQRRLALKFGYLHTSGQVVVDPEPYVTIKPSNPAHMQIPSYDPEAVFAAPAADRKPGDKIHFDSAVNLGGFQPYGWTLERSEVIGGYFFAWGWGRGGIDWAARTLIINHVPWRRTWANQSDYVHPYPDLQRVSSPQ